MDKTKLINDLNEQIKGITVKDSKSVNELKRFLIELFQSLDSNINQNILLRNSLSNVINKHESLFSSLEDSLVSLGKVSKDIELNKKLPMQ